MKRSFRLPDLFGWIGVVLILIAFTGINFDWLTVKQPIYPILNIVGAMGIVISSLTKRDFEPVVLNVVHGLIASIALIRLFLLP